MAQKNFYVRRLDRLLQQVTEGYWLLEPQRSLIKLYDCRVQALAWGRRRVSLPSLGHVGLASPRARLKQPFLLQPAYGSIVNKIFSAQAANFFIGAA
jgi:hypothetical protein